MLRYLLLIVCAAAFAHAEVYCFGFLNSHPERKPIPDAEANKIQEGHMAHMGKMNAAGRLLVAGAAMSVDLVFWFVTRFIVPRPLRERPASERTARPVRLPNQPQPTTSLGGTT